MLVRFVVQANMEFELKCFFYDSKSNVKNISNVFFIANEWTFTNVSQRKKLSKQTGPTCWSNLLNNILVNMLSG